MLIDATQTRSLIRMEGILTALIFDHALRLRVKADTSESKPPEDQPPSAASANSQSKPAQTKNARGGKDGNIVGKIMNMATSDLNNITGGRNFQALGTWYPLYAFRTLLLIQCLQLLVYPSTCSCQCCSCIRS